MKRILMILSFIMLMTSSAMATHLEDPFIGQERVEDIWTCHNIENTKKYANTSVYVDKGISSNDWSTELHGLVKSYECIYVELTYTVKEILETYNGPQRTDFGWSKDKTKFYLLRVDTKNTKNIVIATY